MKSRQVCRGSTCSQTYMHKQPFHGQYTGQPILAGTPSFTAHMLAKGNSHVQIRVKTLELSSMDHHPCILYTHTYEKTFRQKQMHSSAHRYTHIPLGTQTYILAHIHRPCTAIHVLIHRHIHTHTHINTLRATGTVNCHCK